MEEEVVKKILHVIPLGIFPPNLRQHRTSLRSIGRTLNCLAEV